MSRKYCRENFFKDVGMPVDVRFASDHDGRFKGFGHVEFESHEVAKKVRFSESKSF